MQVQFIQPCPPWSPGEVAELATVLGMYFVQAGIATEHEYETATVQPVRETTSRMPRPKRKGKR